MTESRAFTPGPWRYIAGQVKADGKGPRAGLIANVAISYKSSAERDANARLIAASPELYEALGVCLAMAERALKASMNLNGKSPYDIGMDALRKAGCGHD